MCRLDEREDDVLYFSADSALESCAVSIDDKDDMTEDQVKQFVKDGNPDLFKKLRGMKYSSFDIPMSFAPQRAMRRLDDLAAEFNAQSLGQSRTIFHTKPASQKTNKESDTTLQDTSPRDTLSDDPDFQDTSTKFAAQLKLDGVERSTVLSSAEKMYPDTGLVKDVPVKQEDNDPEPDEEHEVTHHSQRNRQLRAAKQLEIDEILKEVEKCQDALAKANAKLRQLNSRESSPDASVLITRPAYMESRKDRYKKQGLTRYDQDKARKEFRKREQELYTSPVRAAHTETRYCYCRDPMDQGEIMKCSNAWCPVGWFHLACIGIDRLPYTNEKFFCMYCTEDDDLEDSHCAGTGGYYVVKPDLDMSALAPKINGRVKVEPAFEEDTPDHPAPPNSPQSTRYPVEDHFQTEEADDEEYTSEDHSAIVEKVNKWRAINEAEVPDTPPSRCSTTAEGSPVFPAYPTSRTLDPKDDDSQKENDERRQLRAGTAPVQISSPDPSTPEDVAYGEGTVQYYNTETPSSPLELTRSSVEPHPSSKKRKRSDDTDSAYSIDTETGTRMHVNEKYLKAEAWLHAPPERGPVEPASSRLPPHVTDTVGTTFHSRDSVLPPVLCNMPLEGIDRIGAANYYGVPRMPGDPVNPLSEAINSGLGLPRTPPHVPWTGREVLPWGTPVNSNGFSTGRSGGGGFHDLIREPVSPSPAPKNKVVDVTAKTGDDHREKKNNGDLAETSIDGDTASTLDA